MVLTADSVDRKKKLLEESYVLIERLKKLRALNADPRMVGIDICQMRREDNSGLLSTRRVFRE